MRVKPGLPSGNGSVVSLRPSLVSHRDSAVKRLSLILRSHTANLKIRHALAVPWVRTPILLLLVFMNVVSAIYLGIWAAIFLVGHPILLATLNPFSPIVSGVAYLGLALWHAYDIGIVVFGTHKLHQMTDREPRLIASFHLKWLHKIQTKLLRRLLLWIAKYELFRLARHALVVVVLSIHAHHVSENVVDGAFAFTYTLLVAFYCFLTPSCLLSSHPFIKRYVTLLNDAFFHFLLSTGLSAFVFIPQVVDYAPTPTWFEHYFDDLVLTNRALISTSAVDFVLFLFIFGTNHLTLHQLTHVALAASSVEEIQSMISKGNESKSSTRTLPPHSPIFRMTMFQGVSLSARRLTARKLVAFREQRPVHFKLFFAVNVLWGFVLVVAACTGMWHAPCPPGCVAFTSPWFHPNSCTCKRFRLDCQALGMFHDDAKATALLDTLDASLFSLDVVHCGFPQGLATVDRFRQLFALRLEFNDIQAWPASTRTLPSSLQVFALRYSPRLSAMPAILVDAPPSIVSLIVDGTNISTVPESLATWPRLMHVRLASNRLTAIPTAFQSHATLSLLDLHSNAIDAVALSSLPVQIHYVDLSMNRIQNLSKAFVHAYVAAPFPLRLVANPIELIEPSLLAWALIQASAEPLDIAATPLCARLGNNSPVRERESAFQLLVGPLLPPALALIVCYATCAPQCGRAMLGDRIPDVECNVSACAFDNGDFSP
ncbi:hypothetical protein AC1031_020666 [Aphanomyces cochlioides]|nr:hypothetical protein AC1031_020666 [Aphanomyces cochlioides]